MIRAFTIFSKLNFLKLSDVELYLQATQNFSKKSLPCLHCGAKRPSWSHHGTYARYLISFKRGAPVTSIITIDRLICSSCNHTHAILPEILIPHSSYGLLFILQILQEYFDVSLTVVELCDKYEVSISTLYAWKRLFLLHKKLWLGILEDSLLSSTAFLGSMPSIEFSDGLRIFFRSQRLSFLQGVSKTTLFGSG